MTESIGSLAFATLRWDGSASQILLDDDSVEGLLVMPNMPDAPTFDCSVVFIPHVTGEGWCTMATTLLSTDVGVFEIVDTCSITI